MDIVSHEIIAHIHSPSNFAFYGHGQFSSDGRLLYSTGIHNKDRRTREYGMGRIFVYDFKNHSLDKIYDSFGFYAHDCCLMNDGKEIFILNTSEEFSSNHQTTKSQRPSMVVINSNNGSLIKKVHKDTHIRLGHIQKYRNKQLILSGAKMTGKTSLDSSPKIVMIGKKFDVIYESNLDEDKGYFLSTAYNSKYDLVGFTNPEKNEVLLMNIHTKKILKRVKIQSPHGIDFTSNGNLVFISSQYGIDLVDVNTLETSIKFGLKNQNFRSHAKIVTLN
ncbi:DUF1513 domain-containing protein [Bacteriovoracaceae bacterium]|nr:DUF1513 domain-containing protein [Bacteriovoracaceae bacterium]